MECIIVYDELQGVSLLDKACAVLTQRCVNGILHVYQEPSYAVEYVLGPQGYDPALKERAYFGKTLEATAEDLRKEYADCDSEFRDGVPSEEIVNTARERDIDLIIISTYHYNWLTRLACGSDAEHILRNTRFYICASCNSKKSHNTLIAFAAKHGKNL